MTSMVCGSSVFFFVYLFFFLTQQLNFPSFPSELLTHGTRNDAVDDAAGASSQGQSRFVPGQRSEGHCAVRGRQVAHSEGRVGRHLHAAGADACGDALCVCVQRPVMQGPRSRPLARARVDGPDQSRHEHRPRLFARLGMTARERKTV